MAGKAACKKALQERFGLTVDPKIPLFGIVSRFAPQKGFDLIRGALPQALRDMIMQVVVLGTGDPFTENFFRWLHGAFPQSANAHIGFLPELSHLIEAGSDFFIMPSLYEPCGLNQMYSSLYGTLPIVRATGGLDDTVENYNEAAGTRHRLQVLGNLADARFSTPSAGPFRPGTTARTITRPMQQQGMARNFTWDRSARQYEHVYDHAMAHRAALLAQPRIQRLAGLSRAATAVWSARQTGKTAAVASNRRRTETKTRLSLQMTRDVLVHLEHRH